MEEYFKIYKRGSIPLQKVDKVVKGDYVYTSTGDCFLCVEDKQDVLFQEFHESVLNKGELIETLEPDVLKLFWVLSDKSFNKNTREINNNLDEGDEIKDTIEYGE